MHDLGQGVTLVTGGAGFIGSAVAWALNNRDLNNVWLADFLEGNPAKQRNLDTLSHQRYLDAGELRQLVRTDSKELSEVNTVIHLGACSSTTETDENYLHDNNFLYTLELCEWALAKGARFVYASSAATYGDGSAGMDDKTNELEQYKPLNLYGWSKHKFDLHARDESLLSRIVGLKYFNVYGPNEEHKGDMRSVVSKAFAQIQDNAGMTLFRSHIPEYRDGEQQRDFLYVKDAVRMTLHLAEHDEFGGLYNLGCGKARTWLDLAHAIFAALDKNPDITFVDMPESIRDKYQYHTQADISKIRQTGYSDNLFDLEDAVGDYVRSYLVPNRRLGE
jgi:ADP-L-glycero-D-manno-heptose 6-epimerase